jgi:hypothetical protein
MRIATELSEMERVVNVNYSTTELVRRDVRVSIEYVLSPS